MERMRSSSRRYNQGNRLTIGVPAGLHGTISVGRGREAENGKYCIMGVLYSKMLLGNVMFPKQRHPQGTTTGSSTDNI